MHLDTMTKSEIPISVYISRTTSLQCLLSKGYHLLCVTVCILLVISAYFDPTHPSSAWLFFFFFVSLPIAIPAHLVRLLFVTRGTMWRWFRVLVSCCLSTLMQVISYGSLTTVLFILSTASCLISCKVIWWNFRWQECYSDCSDCRTRWQSNGYQQGEFNKEFHKGQKEVNISESLFIILILFL